MEDIKYPVITVNGEEIKAKNPKAIVWRRINDFSFSKSDDIVEDMADLIALTFNDERVTKDIIMENVDLQDITKLYKECCKYVMGIFINAMDEIGKNV